LSLQAFEKSRSGKSTSQLQNKSAKAHFQGKFTDNQSYTVTRLCPLCSSKHYIATCPQYTEKTVQQRLEILSKHKLCYNCLGTHRVSSCHTGKRCQKCGRKHHTTIHKANTSTAVLTKKAEKKEEPAADIPTTKANVHHSVTVHKDTCILLATAQVKVVSPNGEVAEARALIDQGSEITLISERLVQRLRLPRTHSSLSLTGIRAQTFKTKGVTSFNLTSYYDSSVKLAVSAHILPRLTSSIPSVKIRNPSWQHLSNLTLTDPRFLSPRSIDLILGADIYSNIIEDGLIKGSADMPIAQKTKLGWIISGPTSAHVTPNSSQSYHVSADQELYDLLHSFWEIHFFFVTSII